jgi:tetratricopeptide (TPR) repeat protein
MRCLTSICLTAVIGAASALPAGGQTDHSQGLDSFLATAQQALARKDYSAAADSYRKALKVSPNAAELWADLGLMDHETGSFAEAVKSFTEAARLDPSLYVPQLFLGIDYLELNRAETAIPFLQKAEKLNPADPQAPLTLGRALAMANKGIGATDAYWRAVTLAPRSGNAWLGLGKAYLQQVDAEARVMTTTYEASQYGKLRAAELFAEQGKLIQSARDYQAVLSMASPPPCSHAGYGIVLLRQKAIADAVAEFDRESKSDQGCPFTRPGLAATQLTQGHTENALRDLVAVWQADEGFFQETLPTWRDGVTAEQMQRLSDLASAWQAKNEIPADFVASLQSGSQPHAPLLPNSADSASHAQNRSTSTAPSLLIDSEKLYRSTQFRKCSEGLRPRLAELPEKYLTILSACAFYTGDYRTAASAARRLATNSSTRQAGLYWESKADQKLAIATLTRASQIDANSPGMHVLLGDVYRQNRRWAEAESEYSKALALEPENRGGRLGLAIALFADGKRDAALAADQLLLQTNPSDPQANLLAGEIFIQLNQYSDAENFLDRCSGIQPEFLPRVHALKGEVYANTNRIPEALSEFKLGMNSDDDGSIHFQMARLYQKTGDKKAAAEAFQVSRQLREKKDASATFALQQSSTGITRQ